MSRTTFVGIVMAMSIFLFASPLQAQSSVAASELGEIAEFEQKSRDAFETENWATAYVTNLKLNRLRPAERQYLVNVVRACGMLDRKTSAYHYMLEMQKQGMTFNFDEVAETELIRGTEAYEHINKLLVDAGNPSGAGKVVFSLPGEPTNFTSVVWDSSRDRFLLGTLSGGQLLAVSDNGTSEVLLQAGTKNEPSALTGLAVDIERSRLWASSSAIDKSRGALLEFDLNTLEFLGHFDLPVDPLKHDLGSVAVAADGTVYVIDRATPIIYRKVPGGDRLTPFFASPDLQGISDIAVAPDNSRVFISDPVKGILVIDPVAEQAVFLSGPETMNLGGVNGLEYRDGQLFVVQGGFTPQRVLRLDLDDVDGTTVLAVSPMAIALEEFNKPGGGTIRGDELFYFANSGESNGSSVIVVSTPLDAGTEVAPPDMSQFEEAVRAQSQQN